MDKKIIKKERKLERELLGILGFLAVLVIVFLIASAYFKSLNYFEYEGLTFSKKKIGDIPLFHHTYYIKTQSGAFAQYNFYIRTDPRENNVSLTGKSNLMVPGSVVYISINSEGLQQCRYGALAVGSLSSFISDNQMTVVAGNLDFWQAGSRRDLWATCENRPGNKVIEILKSNETKVSIEGNCYRIEVANCEILEAVEKLETQSIVEARKAFI
ncbi:MAG: hypothetical protein AABX23_00830 [Nanoarchaeota archaeon]